MAAGMVLASHLCAMPAHRDAIAVHVNLGSIPREVIDCATYHLTCLCRVQRGKIEAERA